MHAGQPTSDLWINNGAPSLHFVQPHRDLWLIRRDIGTLADLAYCRGLKNLTELCVQSFLKSRGFACQFLAGAYGGEWLLDRVGHSDRSESHDACPEGQRMVEVVDVSAAVAAATIGLRCLLAYLHSKAGG
jgi:hypothetical protein